MTTTREAATLRLDAIVVGDRARKDMGDLQGLADSITRHGFLHPIVVTHDLRLVAGLRRLEAARLLGLSEIPATIIDVDDLLSAERDENEVRKDFTPTEAVAIGRLIEARERPKAIERQRMAQRQGGLKSAAVRRGEVAAHLSESSRVRNIETRAVVAAAVGMSPASYARARAVSAAAEADPERFGDLPTQMDETGNLTGAYREMRRRQDTPRVDGKPTPRKRPRRKAEQMIQRALDQIDGICLALSDLDLRAIHCDLAATWARTFAEHARMLRAFGRQLAHE